MDRHTQLEARVQQWIDAAVIDAESGKRILTFEAGQERRISLRWPVLLAMAFGGMLVAAGITLFVAAHWNDLSPAFRFSLMLILVTAFHAGGAAALERFPALSTTLHAVGTVALGGAIFLTAQIFNLHENWATGVLLWAIGAAGGYILLKDWAQAAAVALLAPAWLISQWTITTAEHRGGYRPLAMGLLLTSLCYLSARIGDEQSTARRTLVWIGGVALLPCVIIAVVMSASDEAASIGRFRSPALLGVMLLGWSVALIVPLALAWALRQQAAWMNLVAASWAYFLIVSAGHIETFGRGAYGRNFGVTVAFYLLCAIGAVGLVAWGLHERRKERVNLGVVGFALTVLFFYFDNFMGKLGRSASLLILGALCLALGYGLEIARRRLVARMEANP